MEDRVSPWRGVMGILAIAVAVAAISGAFAGASVALLVSDNESDAKPDAAAAEPGPSTLLKVTEESALTETFSKVSPGVVTLIVQAQHLDSNGRVVRETNLGSGVIVDERGYLVTNEHVVRDATQISVIMNDGSERPGVLVGDDAPFTDVAVVRIQPSGITVVPVGDSNSVQPGQGVLAIGSVAFNQQMYDQFRNNVTRGVVSGVHRRWPKDDTVMEDLIQTDAAINHGNSGGALVTLDGQLIGIMTTVVRGTQSGQQVQGVGFAISSRSFKPLIDQIIANGKTDRPYVGIVHQTISADQAQRARLPVTNGAAAVVDVIDNSPASRAGVQKGDIITKLADYEINDDQPYLYALVKMKPNTTVPLTVLRGGQEMQLSLDILNR
ncbi:MAG TPA: trypsin-like peptidase domain-containing protein [Thermomicrobiales bacterium]|nr:trypsin-like peptidase domain-containing protein [Thermomicrobiales bacterium]